MMVKEVMEAPYIMTFYNFYNHHHFILKLCKLWM